MLNTAMCASFKKIFWFHSQQYLCVCACVLLELYILRAALGRQPDRNILSLSEKISLSCVLPLMKVCHRLEMQPFDLV